MKVLFIILGIGVLLVVLASSGVVGAGLCVDNLGCIATSADGAIRLDGGNSATIGTNGQ
jgi:hypothetical protein